MRTVIALLCLLALTIAVANAQKTANTSATVAADKLGVGTLPPRSINDAATRARMIELLTPFRGAEVGVQRPLVAPTKDELRLYAHIQRVLRDAKWSNDETSAGDWDGLDGYNLRVDKSTDARCAAPADALVAAMKLAGLTPYVYPTGPADPSKPCPRIIVFIG